MAKESELVKKSFYESTNLSENEFKDLVALAESMRQYHDSQPDLSLLPKDLMIHGLTLQTALQAGKSLGLDGYMQKAINSRYVPHEIQLANLEEVNARPNSEALIAMYQNEMRKALAEFPDISVGHDPGYIYSGFHIYRDRTFYTKTLFGKKLKVSRQKLAVFQFNDFYSYIRIEVCDPLILRLGGKKIKRLKERSDWEQNIVYAYPVGL